MPNPHAKLTAEEVSRIKTMLNNGVDRNDIAEEFGISLPTVSSIRQERSWTLTEPRIINKTVKRGAKYPINCQWCGTELMGKIPHQRFCTMRCAQDWHLEQRKLSRRSHLPDVRRRV